MCPPHFQIASAASDWLFSEPPTSEKTQQTFSHMKKFCNSQVCVITFSGGVGKSIADCFLVRQRKQSEVCMNSTVGNDFFWISQGTVTTSDRRGGQSVSLSSQISSGFQVPKSIKIG